MSTLNTCTSSTRPATAAVGDMLYETDTDKVIVCSNASGPVFQAYNSDGLAYDDSTISALSPKLWLDTSYDSVYTDAGSTLASAGEQCYTWADRSGNGFDFVQSTLDYQPIYMPSGAGGRPYIFFDSTDKLTFTGTSGSEIDVSSAGTVFIAVTDMVGFKETANTNQYFINQPSNFKIMRYNNGTTVPRSIQCNFGNKTVYSHQVVSSEVHVFCLRADVSGNETNCYVNGARGTPADGTSAYNNPSGAVQTAPTSGTILSNGVVCQLGQYNSGFNFYEFIAFPTTLSIANTNSVFSYLSRKYGTTVTTIT